METVIHDDIYYIINKDKEGLKNLMYMNNLKIGRLHYKTCIQNLSFDCLEWINARTQSKQLFKHIIYYSNTENDCIELLKWYARKNYYKCCEQFRYVTVKEYLRVFKYMISNGWKYYPVVMDYILRNNSKIFLKAFYDSKNININSPNNVYRSCGSGDFNFYKYYIKLTEPIVRTDLDYALCAYNGHLKFFEELENCNLRGIIYPLPNYTVPFFAAAGGHLDLLKFSFEHNYHNGKLYFKRINPDIEDISTLMFGRSEMSEILIKYLYNDNFNPICKIMDIAELLNKLDCYNYLIENMKNNLNFE